MFYYLSYLSENYEFLSFFRLFDSIMFRTLAAMMTSMLFCLFLGRKIINFLYKNKIRGVERDYASISVESKKGTPLMGGLVIIGGIFSSVILWSDLTSIFVIFSVTAILWFGAMGAYDDYMKVKYSNSDKGLSQISKIILQAMFALVLAFYFYNESTTPFNPEFASQLYIPFIKHNMNIELGWLYIPFVIFTVLAISNAVNFADGMDGLAIVPSMTTAAVYGLFAYIIGNMTFSNYLLFNYVPQMSEITILVGAFLGAGFGFLWFNTYPAIVFMGDTGSMAIGGLLSVIVISTKQELIFLFAGGIFVAEAFSVLVQQKLGINRLGKRIFYRAPLHDSFKHIGLSEPKIVVRFWIVSVILAMVSLLSIKVR